MTSARGWTFVQTVLAALCVLIGAGIAAFGFIDLYLTITHLIAPWWGAWSWTVILLGEGAALGAYLASLLAVLRLVGVPRALGVFLRAYLALFASGSLTLMLYAGRASAPDLVSHAIVAVSFFGYLLLAKVLVRHLSAPPRTTLDDATADARRYAVDLCRSLRGPLWRWRVPSLLRINIARSRFPDEVAEDIARCVRLGKSTGWQQAVREWVTGPDGLNLTARAEADAKRAAERIRQDVPETVLEIAAETVPEPAPRAAPQVRSERVPEALPKLTAKRARGMSPSELVPYAAALLEDVPDVSVRRATAVLHVGTAKASEALRLARKDRLHVAAK